MWWTLFLTGFYATTDSLWVVNAESRHGKQISFTAQQISIEVQELLRAGRDCHPALFFEKDSFENLYAGMYKIASPESIGEDYDGTAGYRYLYYSDTEVRMRITDTALSLLRKLKADNQVTRVLLVYDVSLVITRVKDVSPPIDSAHFLFSGDKDSVAFSFDKGRAKVVSSLSALKNIIRWVYNTDCCLPDGKTETCIPWQFYRWGCEARALKVAAYLAENGYEHTIVRVSTNANNCNLVFEHKPLGQQVGYAVHYAAAVYYKTYSNLIILDPLTIPKLGETIEPQLSNLSEFFPDNWVNRFWCSTVQGCPPGCKPSYTICSSPYFTCPPADLNTSKVPGTINANIYQLQNICVCYQHIFKN